MEKILKAGIGFDTDKNESYFWYEYLEHNPSEKCPLCGVDLERQNSKGKLSCPNPRCVVVSVRQRKNGDLKVTYDAIATKRVVVQHGV